ncbi:MAG: leucine-rich repeat protein [Clostridia bacterium]|nr:leucine-rich repeat protein [Clostridia bacterium]
MANPTDILETLTQYNSEKQAHLPTELKDLEEELTVVFDITSANTTVSPKNLKGLTTINWGDGTIETINDTTGTQTYSHTYVNVGKYIVVFYNVTQLVEACFSYQPVSKVHFSNKITAIGARSFYGGSLPKLDEVIIPDSVTSIGHGVFWRWNPNPEKIVVGKGVTSISNYVFSCNNMVFKSITPPVIAADQFWGSATRIEVPLESVNAYKTATNWVQYADRIVGIVDTNYLDEKLATKEDKKSYTEIEIDIEDTALSEQPIFTGTDTTLNADFVTDWAYYPVSADDGVSTHYQFKLSRHNNATVISQVFDFGNIDMSGQPIFKFTEISNDRTTFTLVKCNQNISYTAPTGKRIIRVDGFLVGSYDMLLLSETLDKASIKNTYGGDIDNTTNVEMRTGINASLVNINGFTRGSGLSILNDYFDTHIQIRVYANPQIDTGMKDLTNCVVNDDTNVIGLNLTTSNGFYPLLSGTKLFITLEDIPE